MAADNAFSIDSSTSQDSVDTARRKKISALGLQGLSQYANEPDAESLSEKPLYGGSLSKSASVSTEADEPSQLATERVQRAPASQNAAPLLPPEERLGNVVTGEEGTYGPLTGEQRRVSLKDFFGSGAQQPRGEEPGQPAGGGEQSRNVGGAGAPAAQALNVAKTGNQAATRIGKSLADLFGAGGAGAGAGASFPSGLSLSGAPTEGFPISPEGFNFVSPEAGSSLNPADFSLSAGDSGAATGGLGNYIGAAGAGVGGALSIAQLINGLVSGNIDTSKTGAVPKTAVGVGVSALPILESIIPGLTGLSGLGLAATPMLIPAIMSIIDMFKEPNFPEVAGQKTHGLSDYRSAMTAEAVVPQIEAWINQHADDPQALLSLAQQGSFGPGNEVNYGGMSLQDLAANPTDEAMRNFIKSASFTSGATGRGLPNTHLTDTYQRTLAHAMGIAPEQAAGLFGPDPYSGGFAGDVGNTVGVLTGQKTGFLPTDEIGGSAENYSNILPSYADAGYQNFGGYSPFYRDPSAGRLSPDQVAYFQDLIKNYLNGPVYAASLSNLAYQGGDGGGDGGGGF